MSEDRPHSHPEAEDLLLMLVEANEKARDALLATSHQAVAGMLVNALLVRELGRVGLVDIGALRTEALQRAEPLGEPVAAVIKSIFGGEPPSTPDVPSLPVLTVIPGGLVEPDDRR